MPDPTFSALLVTENPDGSFSRSITKRTLNNLSPGDVVVRVHYSSLNYKDALSATGNKGVSKHYPHIPGVDAAGVVEQSSSPLHKQGDEVIVHGYELGAHADGGFSEYIRVPADWVVRRPPTLSLRESMIYGTAGFTAGLALHRLLHHGLKPDQGPVVVTGSTGGVGSVAVALLAKAGFQVVAATGKMEDEAFLKSIGANEVIHRDLLKDSSGRGLLAGKWAGAIDNVGGDYLDSILRQTKLFGAVACTGNVRSTELHTSIFPFILRGIALIGINSAFTPMPLRLDVWKHLATDWKLQSLESLVTEVSLDGINGYIDRILKGQIRGRILVNLLK